MADPWFRVKAYGYGAGLPVAWQGWALLGGFFGASIGGGVLLARWSPVLAALPALVLSLPLVLIAERKSDAPWRWRWGGGEQPPSGA